MRLQMNLPWMGCATQAEDHIRKQQFGDEANLTLDLIEPVGVVGDQLYCHVDDVEKISEFLWEFTHRLT